MRRDEVAAMDPLQGGGKLFWFGFCVDQILYQHADIGGHGPVAGRADVELLCREP